VGRPAYHRCRSESRRLVPLVSHAEHESHRELAETPIGISPTPRVSLIIPGAPRTKKTHNRLVRAGGRQIVLPAEAWERWATCAAIAARALAAQRYGPGWWRARFPLTGRAYNCEAVFYRDADRGDAVGYYQGLADVLERLGVVPNDRVLVSWDGSRVDIDRADPRVEVTLTAAETPGQGR
jgi:hypothetical protein